MKKVLKFVLWTFLILFLIISVGAFVFIKTFDLNKYKTQISQIVYDQTGRKLALNGDAGLKISLIPTIELNDVSFSNALWAKDPDMLQVKNIDIAFSILPLLKKEIVIDKVHLYEPKIYLSVNENGVANWDFSKAKTSDAAKTDPIKESIGKDVATGAAIASFLAKSVKIEDGEVVYHDLKTNDKHELKINKIALSSDGLNDDINANIDVVYNKEEIKVNIVAGSVNSVLQNTDGYPISLDVKAFGASAKADGTLFNLLGDLEYDFKISATNPKGNFGAPAVKINTTAKGNLKTVALNISSLNVATNEIKGTINADISGKKPSVKASLNSELIDLLTFSETQNAQNYFGIISPVYAAEFVPDVVLDLNALNMLNANLSLDIKKLILNKDISFDNIKTDVVVKDGTANVNIKNIGAGDGNITGDIIAKSNNEFDIKLSGKDIVLQNLVKNLALTDKNYFGIISGGKTNLLIKLKTKGNTLRTAVENLNGQFITIIGETKLQTGTLKYFSGNFVTQLISALKMKDIDKTLDMSCAVIRTDLSEGKAVFPKGIAFKSNRLTVVSDGSVNLKNDKIDFSIKPFNGKIKDTNIAQAISSMLKVSGTVTNPRLAIDNTSVIKNVVGIAATGPAFLGSQMLFDVDEYPCYTALKGTSYENMFEAPSGAKATTQSVYQNANDVVSDSINLVNGAAKGVLNLLKGKK